MGYTTYWSILDSPSKSISSNSVLLCVVISAGFLWFLAKKYKKDEGEGEKAIVLWATGAFAILGLGGYVVLTFFYPDKSNEKTLEWLNAPTTPRVEGVVSNFQRKNRKVTIESFRVDSVQFAYDDALLGRFNSFSQTNNHVIFNGQKVRITYGLGSYGDEHFNSILKLEIADN